MIESVLYLLLKFCLKQKNMDENFFYILKQWIFVKTCIKNQKKKMYIIKI